MATSTIPAQRADLLVEVVDTEVVVLDVRADRVHKLSGSTAAVFTAIDGTSSIDEVAARTGLDADQVTAALALLADADLLAGGISRRQLLMRGALVGGAALALPAIVTIATPAAASAASFTNPGSSSTPPSTVFQALFTEPNPGHDGVVDPRTQSATAVTGTWSAAKSYNNSLYEPITSPYNSGYVNNDGLPDGTDNEVLYYRIPFTVDTAAKKVTLWGSFRSDNAGSAFILNSQGTVSPQLGNTSGDASFSPGYPGYDSSAGVLGSQASPLDITNVVTPGVNYLLVKTNNLTNGTTDGRNGGNPTAVDISAQVAVSF